MSVSVIIPCYNAADTISDQLEALAQQHWIEPWEVVVADNGSTDRSVAAVERYRDVLPDLHIVDASKRPGAAHARNVGARAARGTALLFCDADDEVAPGWVSAMADALAKFDLVASRFDIEKLNAWWMLRSHPNPQQNDIQQYRYPAYLPHAGGGGLGVKRSLYEAIGGFDEGIAILDDTDFCWRAQLAGAELHFVPDAVVHVRYRDTLRGTYRQARGLGESNVVLYKKYRPYGMPRLSWKEGTVAWWRLFRQMLWIRNKESLARWLWAFGWRMGRLQGSLKHRVLAL
jgi:glycosyltransferase involved in cell wall biosynthesis